MDAAFDMAGRFPRVGSAGLSSRSAQRVAVAVTHGITSQPVSLGTAQLRAFAAGTFTGSNGALLGARLAGRNLASRATGNTSEEGEPEQGEGHRLESNHARRIATVGLTATSSATVSALEPRLENRSRYPPVPGMGAPLRKCIQGIQIGSFMLSSRTSKSRPVVPRRPTESRTHST